MSGYLGFEPVEQEKDYYFVSYNSDDITRIQPLVKGLFDIGVPLWYDHALEYGKEWKKQIARKISGSRAVLLFITKGVLNKEYSYVREEYEMATVFFEKKVYVVLLDMINARDVPTDSVPWWVEVIKNHIIDLSEVVEFVKQIEEISKVIGYSANFFVYRGFVSNGKNELTGLINSDTSANNISSVALLADSQEYLNADEEISSKLFSVLEKDVTTLYKRGWNFYYGRGVKEDYHEAFRHFMKAAEQGYARAQEMVGKCYYYGRGTAQNYEESFKWYLKAAEQGLDTAQSFLGSFYYYGYGMPKDYVEAFKWYKKAADQYWSPAQRSLGDCYYYGRGTPKNYEEAFKWYRKAADQELATAQKKLGDCYYYGHGTPQNFEEAIKWYKKAADQGTDAAQKCLGDCYYYGRGTSKNIEEAIYWYRNAAQQGNQSAKDQLIALGM